MKQVALAMHSYHSARGKLPATINNANPNPGGWGSGGTDSWNAMIFPMLELQGLYDSLDLRNKLFQTANNRAAASVVMPGLICPSDPAGSKPIFENRCNLYMSTWSIGHGQWYAGSFGPRPVRNACHQCPTNAAWRSSPIASRSNSCCNGDGTDTYTPGFFSSGANAISFDDCQDGTSNTFLLCETLPRETGHNGVFALNPMTVTTMIPVNTFALPAELPPDVAGCIGGNVRDNRMNGMKSHHPNGATAALADGSTHFISETISMPVMWALGTRKLGSIDVVQPSLE